ncbi:hypothetical protein M422DRAFT_53686 [Sphaerobolus stellatus SS14]|uniref:Major facilitator superfamily (MFS) profile domain-containing protein n=1 Tax=Sphaerobolus stellatus (strain SS14) TaxID=990650 RepID=A0A0C9U860_SPHS4|nr:hypothetical protein M422DRAFT_53686 [Sphaerobolus stellatus SS14]
MNASSLPGRLLPNVLADKVGPLNVMIPSLIITAGLVFTILGIKSVSSILAFTILYGFFSGACTPFVTSYYASFTDFADGDFSLCSPAVATLAKNPSEVGVRFGIAFFVTSFGALTGTPIDGSLLDETFPWFKPIIFSGVAILLGTGLCIVSRQLLVKTKGTQFL